MFDHRPAAGASGIRMPHKHSTGWLAREAKTGVKPVARRKDVASLQRCRRQLNLLYDRVAPTH